MPDPIPSVAIVGGGASGTLAAIHLLRAAPVRVVLVEPGAPGRGVAYATPSVAHVLNVPAGKMSAFPDAPTGFLDWLRAGPLPEATASTFAPRALFGRYLDETLAHTSRAAAPGAALRIVRDMATSVDASGVVRLATGETLRADRVVLALGQSAPAALSVLEGLSVVADPWASGALEGVRGRVLLVGTGLTMADVALVLSERGVSAMTAVSRRGLVAQGHAPPTGPPVEAPEIGLALAETLRAVRAAAQTDWRAAIDALRPTTAARWAAFSDAERRSALRHLRPFWDVHRHRAAPPVAEALAAMRASGILTVLAGRLAAAEVRPEGVAVHIARRGGGDVEVLVDHVVLCTGAQPATGAPVIAGLVATGAAVPDALGLGIETDASGALIGADGQASDVLVALGPLRQGTLWESTAIPEIRAQAAALAARLVGPR